MTREVADYAASQIKGTIEAASVATRQLLEDVQASLHDAIAGDAILKSYSEETRQQFGGVIRTIIESSLTQALAMSQKQMDEWLRGALDRATRNAQRRSSSGYAGFPGKAAWCVGKPFVGGVCWRDPRWGRSSLPGLLVREAHLVARVSEVSWTQSRMPSGPLQLGRIVRSAGFNPSLARPDELTENPVFTGTLS